MFSNYDNVIPALWRHGQTLSSLTGLRKVLQVRIRQSGEGEKNDMQAFRYKRGGRRGLLVV